MKKHKEPSTEKKRQMMKYPIGLKVKFKPSYWVESEGVIINYTDSSKQVVLIRDKSDLNIYPRSLNNLDQFN